MTGSRPILLPASCDAGKNRSFPDDLVSTILCSDDSKTVFYSFGYFFGTLAVFGRCVAKMSGCADVCLLSLLLIAILNVSVA
jgi:hypothetical protein